MEIPANKKSLMILLLKIGYSGGEVAQLLELNRNSVYFHHRKLKLKNELLDGKNNPDIRFANLMSYIKGTNSGSADTPYHQLRFLVTDCLHPELKSVRDELKNSIFYGNLNDPLVRLWWDMFDKEYYWYYLCKVLEQTYEENEICLFSLFRKDFDQVIASGKLSPCWVERHKLLEETLPILEHPHRQIIESQYGLLDDQMKSSEQTIFELGLTCRRETFYNNKKRALDRLKLKMGLVDFRSIPLTRIVFWSQLLPETCCQSDQLKSQDLLEQSITTLNLSVRPSNCLYRAKIFKISELTKKTPDDLMSLHSFGLTLLNEVNSSLAAIGLSLKSV